MDLDRMLEDARAEVPEGLAARLVAGARGKESRRQVFWADVDRAARRALAVAAAAAFVTVALAFSAVAATPPPDNTRTASLVINPVQIDPMTGDVETP